MPGVGENPTKRELVEALLQAQKQKQGGMGNAGLGQMMSPTQQRPQIGKGMGQAMSKVPPPQGRR